MNLKDAKLCLTGEDMCRALTYGLDAILQGDFEVKQVGFEGSSPRPYTIYFAEPVKVRGTK